MAELHQHQITRRDKEQRLGRPHYLGLPRPQEPDKRLLDNIINIGAIRKLTSEPSSQNPLMLLHLG